jgi:hypothetical protein
MDKDNPWAMSHSILSGSLAKTTIFCGWLKRSSKTKIPSGFPKGTNDLSGKINNYFALFS